MIRSACLLLTALALGSCGRADNKTHLYLQRFFGECGAEYGGKTDIAAAEGECGIITTMIERFNAENPDVHVDVNVVAWPGYPQLTAQMAARDPPDLVTIHAGGAPGGDHRRAYLRIALGYARRPVPRQYGVVR